MVDEAEVVVVGAGVFGASAAYHLAALGRRGVLLIDAGEVGSQTSGRAAGLTKQVRFNADLSRLTMLGVDKILRFTKDTGQPLAYVQSGSVSIAQTAAAEAVVRAEIAAGSALGLDTYPISYDEMTLAAPLVRPRDIRFIAYTPSDLYLEEPVQLVVGYARAAEALGAAVVVKTEVTGIRVVDGRVAAVETTHGEVRTGVVIDAAGAWSRLLAERAGVRVPLVPVRHQLQVTERIPGLNADHAICRFYDAGVYLHPHGGGVLLGGYEAEPQVYDMHTAPPGFQMADLPLDPGVLDRLAEAVRKQVAVENATPIQGRRGGLPTMTPDGLPIISAAPGVEGLYVLSGCCTAGIALAPAAGEMLAELVHTGLPSLFLDAFSLARFGAAEEDEAALREACLRQYTGWYSAVSPVPRSR